MQKLSNGCMNLCVWACDTLKSKGQGAIGYRERVKCHRLRGALLYHRECIILHNYCIRCLTIVLNVLCIIAVNHK